VGNGALPFRPEDARILREMGRLLAEGAQHRYGSAQKDLPGGRPVNIVELDRTSATETDAGAGGQSFAILAGGSADATIEVEDHDGSRFSIPAVDGLVWRAPFRRLRFTGEAALRTGSIIIATGFLRDVLGVCCGDSLENPTWEAAEFQSSGAGNTNVDVDFDTDTEVQICGVYARIVTDATVANRAPGIYLFEADGGNTIFRALAEDNTVASDTGFFALSPGGAGTWSRGTFNNETTSLKGMPNYTAPVNAAPTNAHVRADANLGQAGDTIELTVQVLQRAL